MIQIANKLSEIYSIQNADKRMIYNYIGNMREIIANYLRRDYSLDPLAQKNAFNHITYEESLFSHINRQQIWVVGLYNNESNELRVEIVPNRDGSTLKSLIENNVPIGNYIVTDAWNGSSFLDSPASGYIHHTHVHGKNDFGRGVDTPSKIEGILTNLKRIIKKMYNCIQSKNLIYFIEEVELRRKIKNLNCEEKLNEF